MQRRLLITLALASAAVCLTGCPKGNEDFKKGKQAEAIQDYDTALEYYNKALKVDPLNAAYKLRSERMRFEAGQAHVDKGKKALVEGQLQLALAEFQRAQAIDPSSAIAEQEVRQTMQMLQQQSGTAPPPAPSPEAGLMTGPPELKPISTQPINLKMTNDSKIVFETIAKLAGLTVIFDPEFTSRRISTELPNVTLEQALDAVALESKAFWKPITPSIIFVTADQTQKRRDYEDEVVKTFYLANTITPQDLTEIVNGLRQLFNLQRIQQVNAQNAIVVRDTPDKLLLIDKILRDIDKAKPEVVIQVEVLQVQLDRLQNLGIQPGSSAVLTFTPRTSIQPNGGSSSTSGTSTTTTTTTPQVTLKNLQHLSSEDYSLTLPGASATALLTDSSTKIIQNPEIRVTDGQTAKLRIGDRVPTAQGSFQAGVGVGVSGATGVVNPLVNTQFQYIDVGVNIDVTPRVHPDGDVSLKMKVEVSSVSGTRNIGGIDQPVISQRTIEHDIRLKEGEVSILGGLIQRTETKSLNGWPGVSRIPLLRYLFSQENKEIAENEVVIALVPRIVRMPTITAENLQGLAAGTDTNIRVLHAEDYGGQTAPPQTTPAPGQQPAAQPPTAQPPAPVTQPPAPSAGETGSMRLRFDPPMQVLQPGQSVTIGLVVENAKDLFAIPLLLQYNPAVIQIDEVRNGGFLSGGTQEIAIVQNIDSQRGQVVVSATRQPGTPGINGSGTLLGIVVRGIAPGTSPISIVQVNAHDSQQRPIPAVTGEVTVQVK